MPAWPGAHLVLIHAHFTLAPFKACLNAGARLDHARQLRQRRLCQLCLTYTCRREVVMIAIPGVLIGGIARGPAPQEAVVREWLPSNHQPFLGSRTFALDPRLHPAPDYLNLHRPFSPSRTVKCVHASVSR